MKLNHINFEEIFTPVAINKLRDERCDILDRQLCLAIKEFDALEVSMILAEDSDHHTTYQRIKTHLETHYREMFKKKFLSIFTPWNYHNHPYDDINTEQFFALDDKFFLRNWHNNLYHVFPVASGHQNSPIVTIVTPEEMRMKGDNNIPEGYSNPFLAMLSFYNDIVQAIQEKYGYVHPRCDTETCNCWRINGRCYYQDLRIPVPEMCVRGIKGKEVK